MAIEGHEIYEGVNAPGRHSNFLYYSVREPFPGNTTGTNLVFGKITDSLQITALMPESGVIFSDGVEQDFMQFPRRFVPYTLTMPVLICIIYDMK